MKATTKRKRSARKAAVRKRVKKRSQRNTYTMTLPELRVVSAPSIEGLLEQIERAGKEGFERQGEAYFDAQESNTFRQAMVRYKKEGKPSRARKVSARKLGK